MQPVDEIYQRYAMTVYKFLLSKTGSEDLSEELTQETFYQAVRSIGRYDENKCSVSTWLCAIAKNQLSVYYRKHPKTETLEENARVGASAEESVIEAENRVEILRKLHSCPEPYREVLYLRIYGDLSFREIGEIMGFSENRARVTFYRGKEKLRKELTENDG
ncbi:MAG: RNA polymerase sigma factor [Acutalibacteraceae bacterium]